ncbi:hypothetical protein [Variovorax sp. dw_308]|uniref:hypothetical protein n=1 Tax=Variovorax sp. dw_308 TaxID=2721546 RepID=UPI001C490B9F|nr:hypothetical protein [Variovorax sp. dw_308]
MKPLPDAHPLHSTWLEKARAACSALKRRLGREEGGGMKLLLFPLAGAMLGYYLSERGGVGLSAVIGALATLVFTLAGAGIGLLASLAIAGIQAQTPETEKRHLRVCNGTDVCPGTGEWIGSVDARHPQARTFNVWNRTAYVVEGQAFPDPQALVAGVQAVEVTWKWVRPAPAEQS